MRVLQVGLAVGTAATLLALSGIAGQTAGADAQADARDKKAATQTPTSKARVDFTERSRDRLAGSLPREGARPAVSFASRIREVGASHRVHGEKTKTTLVETRVDVGDLSIAAERDLAAQKLTTGAGGAAVTAPQKRALTALCQRFEGSYGALGTPLPQKKDLLLRTTCYYAEAPVGYPIKTKTLEGPSAVYIQEVPEGSAPTGNKESPAKTGARTTTAKATSGALTRAECTRAVMAGNTAKATACQRNGQDGIVELPDCSPHQNTLYWDAKNPRMCYGNRGHKATGPCTSRCKGRCGAECGNTKNGYYTRDCAEHDDCSYRTNASGGRFDENCGDEWGEAVDDFSRRYRRTCSSCRG